MPKMPKPERRDLIPSILLMCRSIQQQESKRLLRVLLDSGGSHSLIHSSVLPKGATPLVLNNVRNVNTIMGSYQANRKVYLRDLVLPEFDKTKRIDGLETFVFDSPCRYDMILGRDFLGRTGIGLDFANGTIKWLNETVAMKDEFHFRHSKSSYLEIIGTDDDDQDGYILDAKYEATSARDIAQQQKHLSVDQRKKLETVLHKYNNKLFDGKLGHYPHKRIHLELDSNAQPKHAKPYAVPHMHEAVFKKELEHLVEIGVLRKCGPTEWASPTFIIPKKDGRVRWISDFRELNKVIKRNVYPLPVIHEVLQRRSGWKYFTKLDLTMFYYSLELDEPSKQLCTIITPFGKFQYNRMAMGLKPAPDVAQSIIEDILKDLGVDVYIDDIGIFSNDFNEHLQLIDTVCQRLEDNGLKVNPAKCEWIVQETDFLGHWLTPQGIKPWKKKVDAILKMAPPTNISQLRSFLGAVTYYRNMWPRRSHLLSPLTELTGKGSFVWSPQCQKAFDEMKSIIAADVLLAYPDHNLPFEIYTDASDYQMGAAILQNGKPIAYWSRKLNDAQKNYTTMEKELLAVVMCLKEFRTMLLGARLTVFTDHKNLTFRTLNSQRVIRWRLYLEDYHPTFKYVQGKDNVLADCFSRLPQMDKATEGKSSKKGKLVAFEHLSLPPPSDELDDEAYHLQAAPDAAEIAEGMPCLFSCCRDRVVTLDELKDESSFFESFLNHPPLNVMQNPITMLNIQQHQFEDVALNDRRNLEPHRFPIKYIQGRPLICYRLVPHAPESDWKIALPTSLIDETIRWYHLVLGHCGEQRLYDTIRSRFQVPNLRRYCQQFTCQTCQKNKQLGPGYGHLPPRHAPLLPWDAVAVDLIGPWTIKVGDQDLEFNALTCIDPVTNLVEMIRIDRKTAAHVSQQFANTWLSQYPRPNKCIHDNGGEFIGWEFQQLLQQVGIEDKPTTSRNPQANAVCERMHQTVANVLRTTLATYQPANLEQANQIVENALATAVYATRCAVSQSIGTSPGNLVFRRDMFIDLPLLADLVDIQNRRQLKIDENLRRQNRKRKEYHFQAGQQVLIKTISPNKLDPPAHGPYPILQTYTNGTIDIARAPHVIERINIRRVIPYRAE